MSCFITRCSIPLRQSLSLILEQARQAASPNHPVCPSHSTKVTAACSHTWLLVWLLGSELRSSCLCSKRSYPWNRLSSPNCLLFKEESHCVAQAAPPPDSRFSSTSPVLGLLMGATAPSFDSVLWIGFPPAASVFWSSVFTSFPCSRVAVAGGG